MKDDAMSTKTVSYTLENLPPISDERLAEMKVQSTLPVDTSDIPELTDEQFKAAALTRLRRPRTI